MKALVAVMLLCVGMAGAQEDFSWLEFHMLRPGLPVPEYSLRVYEKLGGERGTGEYRAENVGVPAANKYSMTAREGETTQALDLTPEMKTRLFALLQATHGLAHCDAHRKGIADTGAKRLTFHEAYQPMSAATTCSYNYSEDKAVSELTDLFQGMALTLDDARQMARDQKYDRLALDGDMARLVQAVKDGQALGLSNIRGVLQGLVDDPAVLERVRVQADKLLQQSLVAL